MESPTTHWISRLLARELDGFAREIALFPDDQLLWQTAPGISNSAGNLAVHVAGNLRHFIGAGLGNNGYVRDRDAEFSRKSGTREEVTAELMDALRMVEGVLAQLPGERLLAPYPEDVLGMKLECGQFLMHLCVHAGHHLGQAGYLRRVLMQESKSSNPLPVKVLGG